MIKKENISGLCLLNQKEQTITIDYIGEATRQGTPKYEKGTFDCPNAHLCNCECNIYETAPKYL